MFTSATSAVIGTNFEFHLVIQVISVAHVVAGARTSLYVSPQFRVQTPRIQGAGVAPGGHRSPLASRQLH